MLKARVIKVICPSCEGTGKFRSLNAPCMWCRGEKRLPTKKAHRYADNLFVIAGGGYICGDLDLDAKIEMEKRAEKIYALTGERAPWLSAATKVMP